MKKLFLFVLVIAVLSSCKKDTKTDTPPPPPPANNCPAASCVNPDTIWNPTGTGPRLVFKFKFDSTQARLNNIGLAATIPTNNAAFSPVFHRMSSHYIELAQNDFVAVGAGKVLYKAGETTCGGANALAYCQSVEVREGVVFFSVPIASVTPGSYKWLRVSLAYQNYDIPFLATSTGSITQWGTVASFIGFNTYVKQYKIKTLTAVPSASAGGAGNHLQGYWGFETNILGVTYFADGQSQAGATTVVNPNPNSPIPAGSCLVTGQFFSTAGGVNQPLVITGSETSDIVITVSLSTNKSFEWREVQFDGYYKPEAGEFPVDMGVRGMIPKY
jgi:hypothetical protein